MVDLYRIWADNTKSFIGTVDIATAREYVRLMGGGYKIVPVKVVRVKKNAA